MDSIHPWLDADELKQLAESLMQGDRRPAAPVDNEAAFGDGFVGFAADAPNPPAADAPNPPALARPLAAPALTQKASPEAPQASASAAEPPTPAEPSLPPMVTGPPSPPDSAHASASVNTPPHPVAPRDSPSPALSALNGADASCHQLQSRLAETFGAEKIFILNRDGHTVFGKDHHAHLQFIARSLTRDAERRGLPKGHIHIKVGPGQILEIVPVSLPNGGWVVGTVLPGPLGPEDIKVWVTEISRLSSSLNQL